MKTINKVTCINCDWSGDEEDLMLIQFDINDDSETPTATEDNSGFVNRLLPEPANVDYLKGCPNCLTDSCLTNN